MRRDSWSNTAFVSACTYRRLLRSGLPVLAVIMLGCQSNGAHAGGGALSGGQSLTDAEVRRATVDMVELNHYIDVDGREVFRQTVFYDWSPLGRRYHVRAWRLNEPGEEPHQRPNRKSFRCTWSDNQTHYQVDAKAFRETFSHSDPERVNRRYLAESKRRPLFPKSE